MKNEYLECGIIRSPHGVRGAVNVESWCDSPKILATRTKVFVSRAGGQYEKMNILGASCSADKVVMTLDGITDREMAQGYKNVVLYLHRDDIPVPRGAMLIADMIGLPVKDVDTGVVYGEISQVSDGVKYRLYTVKTEKGDVILPGVSEFVKEITEEGGMLVRPIPGFFD